ncbi:M42 family metallopeptidase [Hazenella sp. IB182353]|nr:M42 family metallopeptidase [Polycladospora coralii]
MAYLWYDGVSFFNEVNELDKKKHSFKQLLQALTDIHGVPGNEGPVREVMKKWLTPYADEIRTDRLGGLIARKGEKGPKVMLAGHLDEVGFLITRITEDGYLQFQTLGGWWSQVLPAQRVDVITRAGNILGVVGSKAPHVMSLEERKKGTPLEKLYIDIGVESKEEAEQLGVRPGDTVVPISPFTEMGNSNRWLAKAMDNRFGCAAVVEVMAQLAEKELPNQLFSVGTVMEEVGRRGAHTATAVVKPDVAIAVDVGIASDTPGMGNLGSECVLGKGPTLVLYDGGHVPHQGLVDLVRKVAETENIPFQYEWIQRGATDASHIHIHDIGVPTVTLGIPARYIHSHASIIDKLDAEMLNRWLVAIVQRLDQETVNALY